MRGPQSSGKRTFVARAFLARTLFFAKPLFGEAKGAEC